MKIQFSILALGLIVPGLLLTGCSTPSLTSEEVMQHFAESLSELNSFHYQANLDVSGNIPTNLSENVTGANIQLFGIVDSEDLASPKFTLETHIEARSDGGLISIAGQLTNLDDYTYFKLTDLIFPTLLPVSLGADSRWYKIRHPDASGDVNKLGIDQTSELTSDQITSIKELIAAHSLFVITEVYPDATTAGQRSYHYQAKLDPNNARHIVTSLSRIMKLDSISSNLDKLDDYAFEIWISKRGFQLTQLKVADIYLIDGVPISFELELAFTRHNEAASIGAPTISEEIDTQNPLFLSGLGI